MVAAAMASQQYGLSVAWAVVVGSILKYFISEGLGRWQLCTDMSLLEGWMTHLGGWVRYYFGFYLVVWTFIVCGALIVATGLAVHAMFPIISVPVAGVVHSLIALVLVWYGGYHHFESLMKVFIGGMFFSFIICAFWVRPFHQSFADMFTLMALPAGSTKLVIATIGGVGGTLTILSYGHWIGEKGWKGESYLTLMRTDLKIAYSLTGLFAFCLMVMASETLHKSGMSVSGAKGALMMASMLEQKMGLFGKYTFLLGFWAATFTSVLGVWQSVPLIFCDFVRLLDTKFSKGVVISSKGSWFRGYLLFLSIIPLVLLFYKKPFGLIILYSIVGAMFMPFIAGTLLWMNSKKKWIGERGVSGPLAKCVLSICLLLFVALSINSLVRHL